VGVVGPNFFLVGAAKSGTTTLYHALRAHGDIFLPAVKEPHYYAYVADRNTAAHLFPDEKTARNRYGELYAGASEETAVGDCSTTNLVIPGAAAAIARDVPSAHIVVILRQPVDRAHAHWRHFLAAGGEDLTEFAEAVRQESARQAAGFPFTYRYLGWGRYSEQIPPFFELFGRSRVLIHLYDDLCKDAEAVVRSTFGFLGVDDTGSIAPPGRFNQTRIPRFRVIDRAPPVVRRALDAIVPTAMSVELTLDPSVRAELTSAFGSELDRLEELIDRDLSAWR